MAETIWQRESCSPGREYMLGKELVVKYGNQDATISQIIENLRTFVHLEPAVRISLDSPFCNPESTVLAIPFKSDEDTILRNFAHLLYQTLIGFYIRAEPKTSHFGIANLTLDGNITSLLHRELEILLSQLQSRPDIAGRLLKNVTITSTCEIPPKGNVFLSETIQKGLDIHVGYRILALGENINCTRVFVPIETGKEIIEQVYCNIECILHQNFITYDENGDKYLKLTEPLVFKELETVLKRSQRKEITRKKILDKLQISTIFTSKLQSEQVLAEDKLYDLLNQIQDKKLKSETQQSINLYTSYLHRYQEASQFGLSESKRAKAGSIGTEDIRRDSKNAYSSESTEEKPYTGVPKSSPTFVDSGRLVRRQRSELSPLKPRRVRVPPKRINIKVEPDKTPV